MNLWLLGIHSFMKCKILKRHLQDVSGIRHDLQCNRAAPLILSSQDMGL